MKEFDLPVGMTIKNGKLYNSENHYAVIIHQGYGSEWNSNSIYSSYDIDELMHCPELAVSLFKLEELYNEENDEENTDLLLSEMENAGNIIENKFPEKQFSEKLSLEWVHHSLYAVINSHSGYESVQCISKIKK